MLADLVIREEGTGKLSLIGCFTNFFSPAFPLTVPRFFIIVSITNVGSSNGIDLAVRIEDETRAEIVFSSSGRLNFGGDRIDRNEVFEIPVVVPGATFTHAGTYCIKVFADGEQLDKRPVPVRHLTSQSQL